MQAEKHIVLESLNIFLLHYCVSNDSDAYDVDSMAKSTNIVKEEREAVMVGSDLVSKLSGVVCSCSDHRLQDKNHIKTVNISIENVAVLKHMGRKLKKQSASTKELRAY